MKTLQATHLPRDQMRTDVAQDNHRAIEHEQNALPQRLTTTTKTTRHTMTKAIYCLFYAISLLPFRLLYVLADIECFMLYHVIRYRRGVVRRNLVTSFPDKSEQEIVQIEKRFYHWFCDYFFEAVKLLSISDAELCRRFTIINSEEVEQCFKEGQDVAAILGHYCNWEWLSCVGMNLPLERETGLIYHPLRNKAFDYLFRKLRLHEKHSRVIPKQDILRYVLSRKKEGIRNICSYISDQGPKWKNIHLWLPFLNHEHTPVFTGGERIMRKMNNAVFYVEMSRPKRGYYTATYKLITRTPNALEPDGITRRFFQMLEQTIRREPAYYLWSHNRWKRTKEEFDRRFQVVNGKVIERT